MSIDKNSLLASHETIRNFNYVKGDVALAFSLKVESKQDLKDFKQCLDAAAKELDDLINN